MYRTRRDAKKRAELQEAIAALDALNMQEYMELAGGKVDKTLQVSGGEMRARRGVANWHEADTLKIMSLRYQYQTKGQWQGENDRVAPVDRANAVPLTRKLSPENLRDLANFIEFRKGDPAAVESIRTQATNALVFGDVSVVYCDTISEKYDVEAENRAHRRGFSYFYFDSADGTLTASAPPGVTWEEDASHSETSKAV